MPIRSKLNRRPLPRIIPWSRASERLDSLDPALARVAPRAASPNIQESLAFRIEVKKSKYSSALRWIQGAAAANEFVVRHAAVCQRHSSPCLDAYPRGERQTRSEHHCIQEIVFKTQVTRDRPIVKRAWQRRDEVDMAIGPSLQKATAWNLDHNLHLGRFR